jgi:hypothetical protein
LTKSITTRMARPLRSAVVTRFIATTGQSAPVRSFGTFGLAGPPLAPFPLAPPNRFSSSAPEPRPESRPLYPGHRMDGNQVSSMLFPEIVSLPGFDVICSFVSRPYRRFNCVRLSGPHMTRSSHAFSVTFTTTAIGQQQLTVVWSLLLEAGSEGPSFISGTAPRSKGARS